MVAPGSPAPTPDTKKPNWILRILLGLLLFGALTVGVISLFVYRWSQQPGVKEKLGAVKDVFEVAIDSATAPGTEALRKLGCKEAAVLDSAAMNRVIGNLDRLSSKDSGTSEIPHGMVTVVCNVSASHLIECSEVAKTYAAAVPTAPESFLVQVQTDRYGKDHDHCSGMYNRDGTLEEAAVPEDVEEPEDGEDDEATE